MSSSLLNQFWIEFIDLYKSLPELWRRDTDEYTNKSLRAKAYQLLVEKYREVDREANIYTVKKKINNLRTCFRRELNKIRKSEETALSQDDIYTPTLWYFPNLEFLIDEEDESSGPTIEVEEVDVDEEYNTPQPKRKRFIPPVTQTQQEDSYISNNQNSNSNSNSNNNNAGSNSNKYDKVRTLSASWEVQYRDLDVRQKLYANRMINEILYQGALGKLHENSYKILEMAVEDSSHDNHYSPASIDESQYILTEGSTEDLQMKHFKTEKRDRRSKNSK